MPMRTSGAIYEFLPAMQDGFVAAEKNNENMNILEWLRVGAEPRKIEPGTVQTGPWGAFNADRNA
jgi:hypothetical protein